MTIFSLLAGSLLAGCMDRSPSGKDLDLLTADPWKYEKAGFDSNDDGIFDALDPRIAGSERENLVVFRKDGTGYSQHISKKDELPFIWTFQNHDSTIYFQDQYYRVRTLTQHRLEMYADQKLGASNTRYVIVLSR
ncbi:hypothetical protein ACQ86N_47995 [Puia sp. P3]|uniref:hypothetical protein n=1 Tax=Puia sp. P3 TaxID=3423952 RepID=UPI003D6706FB